jgi:hypothetical protein
MNSRYRMILVAATVTAGVGFAAPASAQATRTWVSGVGDDVNPCSRTAPCKTFAGAISKTAAGGEINCLDPGGFGAVTIIKAMTISCPYTEGGALAGGNGIVVNAQPTDAVFIRGLDLFGVNPPSNGIRFIAGGTLHIEDCTIRRFNAANSRGVDFQPAGNSQLTIINTTIAENGSGATGGGIRIQPTGTGSARVTLQGVRVQNNANDALRIDTTGSTGTGVTVMIDNSQFLSSTNGINAVSPAATPTVQVMLTDSLIALNGGSGLITAGAGTVMRVGTSTIVANNNGVTIGAGSIVNTYKDNRLDGNFANGIFTAPEIPLK